MQTFVTGSIFYEASCFVPCAHQFFSGTDGNSDISARHFLREIFSCSCDQKSFSIFLMMDYKRADDNRHVTWDSTAVLAEGQAQAKVERRSAVSKGSPGSLVRVEKMKHKSELH